MTILTANPDSFSFADWMAQYGESKCDLPDIVGTYKGRHLVIVGDAACVWDDLEAFGCKYTYQKGSVAKDGWQFMTINRAVETFPGNIEHAYSNEPNLLTKFIASRRDEYRREFNGPKYTHSSNRGAKYHWPWGGWGTSGLGACFVALGLGYEFPIVLCGVPLTDTPHNGEPPWRKTTFTREAAAPQNDDKNVNHHWKKIRETNMVRSMSGRTRQWLGAPPEC